MIGIRRVWQTVLVAGLLAGSLVGAAHAGTIEPRLLRRVETSPAEPVRVWVRFTDRAGAESDPASYAAERARRPARSLERRRLRGGIPDLVAADLPVHAPYVRALEARGAVVRGTSRWLNAASIEIPASAVPGLARLPFVEQVEIVRQVRRMKPAETFQAEPEEALLRAPGGTHPDGLFPGDPSYYGATYKQLQLMQVPALHAQALSGQGVLVCILDSGFRTTHEIYNDLDVVARRDFIHLDDVVDDEPGEDDAGEAFHGTLTLACIAGHKPGTYVGGAFGASVALGRTEDVSAGGNDTETPVEMDYWQFGAEWADSLGADVLSSSLGYFEFDNPDLSYEYADMDGHTTVVTLAAVEAARRGITVLTAAGNEGAVAWHFLIAPADADTVIAVGAVDSFNVVTAFSSRGPSADGRTKPDVTAMGSRVYLPSFTNPATYGRASGTSFSTPLAAGVAALLLESHPTWGPFEIREALRETALNHAAPDNDIGWGLIQGFAAASWVPSTTDAPGPGRADGAAVSMVLAPNPFVRAHGTTVRFSGAGATTLEAHDAAGRRVARLFSGRAENPTSVVWRGTNDAGAMLPAGVYWLVMRPADGRGVAKSSRVVLLP